MRRAGRAFEPSDASDGQRTRPTGQVKPIDSGKRGGSAKYMETQRARFDPAISAEAIDSMLSGKDKDGVVHVVTRLEKGHQNL